MRKEALKLFVVASLMVTIATTCAGLAVATAEEYLDWGAWGSMTAQSNAVAESAQETAASATASAIEVSTSAAVAETAQLKLTRQVMRPKLCCGPAQPVFQNRLLRR